MSRLSRTLGRLGTTAALSAAMLLPIGGGRPADAIVGGTPAANADFPSPAGSRWASATARSSPRMSS